MDKIELLQGQIDEIKTSGVVIHQSVHNATGATFINKIDDENKSVDELAKIIGTPGGSSAGKGEDLTKKLK